MLGKTQINKEETTGPQRAQALYVVVLSAGKGTR